MNADDLVNQVLAPDANGMLPINDLGGNLVAVLLRADVYQSMVSGWTPTPQSPARVSRPRPSRKERKMRQRARA